MLLKRIIQITSILLVSESYSLIAQKESNLEEQNARKPQTYALVIGVSDYENDLAFKDLNFADKDAQYFAKYLKSKAGGNLPDSCIITLYNKEATKNAILIKGIKRIENKIDAGTIKPGDKIIVYFAGHGGAFGLTDSYFFPYDAVGNLDANSSLSIRKLKNYISNWAISGMQVLLIFDACRSANVGIGQQGIDLVSQYLEDKKGEVTLAASSRGQEANEVSELEHGVFTYFLIGGLIGMADKTPFDGVITGNELDAYLSEKVPEFTKNRLGKEQQPFAQWDKFKYEAVGNMSKMSSSERSTLMLEWNKPLLKNPGSQIAQLETPAKTRTVQYDSTSLEVQDYEVLFKEALKQKRLINPGSSSAYYFLKQMEILGLKQNILISFKEDLSIALLEESTKILLSDLNGERKYNRITTQTKADSANKIKHVDFYLQGLNHLDAYKELNDHYELDAEVRCLEVYLKARDIEINATDQKENLRALEILLNDKPECIDQPYYALTLSTILINLDSLNSAMRYLNIASAAAPRWSYPYVSKGAIYNLKKMEDSALYYFKEAVLINPEDPVTYAMIGNYYLNKDKFNDALKYYLISFKKDSLQKNAALNVAECYYELKDYNNAKYYYLKDLIDTKSYYSRYSLGYIALKEGKSHDALVYLAESIRIDSTYSPAYGALGEAFLNLNLNESAKYVYKTWAKFDSLEAYYSLGEYYEKINKYDSAIFYFLRSKNTWTAVSLTEERIKKQPNNKELYYSLGIAYKKFADEFSSVSKREYKNAIKAFEKYVSLEKNRSDAYFQLGQIYSNVHFKEYSSAIQFMNKAIQLEKKPLYYNWLGNIYWTLKNYDSSSYCYAKAISLNSKIDVYWWNLADVCRVQGKYKESVNHHKKAIKLNPSASNFNSIGEVYYSNLKMYDSAAYYYRKAIQRKGNDPLYWMGLGDSYRKLQKYDSAIICHKRYLTLSSNKFTAYERIAYDYIRIPDFSEALKYFELAHQEDKKNNYYEYNMACYYSLKQDKVNSLGWLERAFKKGYKDFKHIEGDADLDYIKKTKEFNEIIKIYK